MNDFKKFLKAAGVKIKTSFSPVAYYTAGLDEITVLTSDCSFSEKHCSKRMALLQKTHYKNKRYIGFRIFGIRHFMHEHKIDLSGRKRVSAVLKKMLLLCPEHEFPENHKVVMLKMLKQKCFYVDIPPI